MSGEAPGRGATRALDGAPGQDTGPEPDVAPERVAAPALDGAPGRDRGPARNVTRKRDAESGGGDAPGAAPARRQTQARYQASADGTAPQRIRAAAVALASALACRIPDRALVPLAELAGDTHYRSNPPVAGLVRANLGRVVGWLADNEPDPARARVARSAAEDPGVLERMVRDAFRHHARYYLEVALAPSFRPAILEQRLIVETPEAVEEAFSTRGPVLFVGLHFGAIELPALYLAMRTGLVATAPMEVIDDPPLQAWFRRTRSSVGVNIVTLREARRELITALRRGEPAGLVADRDLTGGGIDVPFFGAAAPLPAGPALVALESGARVYVAAVRRVRRGQYVGGVESVDMPADGTRRERVEAFLRAEAAAFERVIATAPEQWWGAFFPIWPDLAPQTRRERKRGAVPLKPGSHGQAARP